MSITMKMNLITFQLFMANLLVILSSLYFLCYIFHYRLRQVQLFYIAKSIPKNNHHNTLSEFYIKFK